MVLVILLAGTVRFDGGYWREQRGAILAAEQASVGAVSMVNVDTGSGACLGDREQPQGSSATVGSGPK